MGNGNKESGKRAVVSFIVSFGIALICFVAFGYIFAMSKGTGTVDENIVSISKIIVLVGVFFLVIAFGHALPNVIKSKKIKMVYRQMQRIFLMR